MSLGVAILNLSVQYKAKMKANVDPSEVRRLAFTNTDLARLGCCQILRIVIASDGKRQLHMHSVVDAR